VNNILNKKLLVVSVTAGNTEILSDKFLKCYQDGVIEFARIENKKNESLAVIYNRFLTKQYQDYVVIFVHDDVLISEPLLKEKALDAAMRHDIFGVAGSTGSITLHTDRPALWHLIGETLAGCVFHYNVDATNIYKDYFPTFFGRSIYEENATLIDGLFIGVNVERLLTTGVRFDEECPSKFHYYDLLLCLNAKTANLNIGIYPFMIIHKSHGLTNPDGEFLKGERYFRECCKKIKERNA